MKKCEFIIKYLMLSCLLLLIQVPGISQLNHTELSDFCNYTNSKKLKKDLKKLTKSKAKNLKYSFGIGKDREVLNQYFVEIIKLREYIKLGQNPATSKVNNIQFEILSYKDSVCYIRIVKPSDKILDTKTDEFKKTLHSRVTDKFERFKNEFEIRHHSKLDLESIFNTNTTYSVRGCGFIPIPTKDRQKYNQLIEQNDTLEIKNWIRSGNTELQLYGVEGIYELTERGHLFDDSIYNLINMVESKKGFVSYCEGCVYQVKEIRNIIPYINKEYRKTRRKIKRKVKRSLKNKD